MDYNKIVVPTPRDIPPNTSFFWSKKDDPSNVKRMRKIDTNEVPLLDVSVSYDYAQRHAGLWAVDLSGYPVYFAGSYDDFTFWYFKPKEEPSAVEPSAVDLPDTGAWDVL